MLIFYFLYIFKVQVFYPFDSMLSVSIKYKGKKQQYAFSYIHFLCIQEHIYRNRIHIYIFYIYMLSFFNKEEHHM